MPDSRDRATTPRYNAAPGQDLPIVRRNPQTGRRSLDLLRWGLIPHWTREPSPKLRPINARDDRIATAPMFHEAYAKRRCLVPIDGFFEWRAVKGAKSRQPYAIAMKDRSPFGVAGIWEIWKHPHSGVWVRTFAIVTTHANALVGEIHDRMPVILDPDDYERWLGPEPDPRDLLRPYPAERMTMWRVSSRVNDPGNDDPSLLDPVDEPAVT